MEKYIIFNMLFSLKMSSTLVFQKAIFQPMFKKETKQQQKKSAILVSKQTLQSKQPF